MRVLFISPRFTENAGGDGLYAFHLAHACAARGVEVFVLCIRDGEFSLYEVPTGANPNEENSSYKSLRPVNSSVLGLNYYSRTARRSLSDVLHLISPDIIHIHGIHQYFTIAVLGPLRRFRGPVVMTVHDYKLLCGNAGFFSDRTNSVCLRCLRGHHIHSIMERCKADSRIASLGIAVQMELWKLAKGLDVFTAFLCGSEFVYDLLKKSDSTRSRLEFIRMPILGKREKTDNERKDTIEIAYIGRMVPHKGPTIFADAVRGLEVRKRIFGDGPQRKKIDEMLGNDPLATFYGWVSHEAMDKELGPGSIVVVPYLAHETFCYVALEAMMRGSCVVASDRGAIPELIKDGHNGVLIRQPNAENFRRVLVNLLDNSDLVYRMGKNAKEIVRDVPSLDEHTSSMLRLYDRIA